MPTCLTERTLTKVPRKEAERAIGKKALSLLMEQPGSTRKVRRGNKVIIVTYEEYPGLGERPIREFWLYKGP